MMVIDDNYMAMNDSPNKTPAVSAPVLATFSQMCPRMPGLAESQGTAICQLPSKTPPSAAGSDSTTVQPIQMDSNNFSAGTMDPNGNTTVMGYNGAGAKPIDQSAPGYGTQDQTVTAGDTKQATSQPTSGAAADKPSTPATWIDTLVALATLGLLTGIAYFGYKAIRH